MLVFLPGLICDETVFAPQLRAFPEATAIRGYPGAASLEAMARQVLDQVPGMLDLFGHSMGGRIALEVHRLAPERVRRIALVSTGVHPVSAGEPEKRGALQQIGDEEGFAALVDNWLMPMIAPGNRRADIVEPLRKMCIAQGRETFDAHVRALLGRRDARPELARLRCPTLVMTGSQDSWSPPEQQDEIAGAVRGAMIRIIEGAGHMLTVERPDAVNAAIAQWLAIPVEIDELQTNRN